MTKKKPVEKSKNIKPKKLAAKLDHPQTSHPIMTDIVEHKQTDKALRSNEEFLSNLLDNAPISIYVTAADGSIILVNKHWKVDTGMQDEQVIGRPIKQIFSAKTARMFAADNKKVLESGVILIKEEEAESPVEQHQFYTVKFPLHNSQGQPEAVAGISMDITERKQAEEALRESEDKYRGLVTEISEGIFVTDDRGKLTFANPALASMMGFEYPDQIIGRNFMEFILPSRINEVTGYFRQAIKTGKTREAIIVEVVRADGTNAIVEVKSHPIMREGKVAGTRGRLRDITEFKRAEAERQALLEIMQGLVATKNLQEFLQLIHHSIAKVIYAENFFVVFHNKSSGLFEEVYAVDQYDAPMPPSKLGKSITAYVFRTGEPLSLNHEAFEELAAREEVELVGTKFLSWLGAPLKTPSETIGVIVVQNYEQADCYSERDREFLSSVGVQVSLAIERKQAENALMGSESSLQAVLQSTADGILAVNSENEILYANERFMEMWRIPKAVAASKDDSVLLQYVLDQLSDPKSFLKKVQELYKSKQESFDTLDFKDGRIFERLSHPLLEGAKVRGRVWSFRDITARKRAEVALAASEAELRALFASMHDVVMVIDRLGVYLKIAPTNPELLVKPPEGLLGKTLRDVFPPEQAETYINFIQQVLVTKQTTHIEYDLIIGDRTVWFETSISPMTDDSTLWVARDITARKQVEQALRENENLLRESQTIAGLGSYVLDIPNGSWKSSNVLDKVFGIDENYERSMDGWTALTHPDDRTMMVDYFNNEVVGLGKMFDKEYRIVRHDDLAERWVHGIGKLAFNANGQPLKMQGTIQDITGRRQAEEQIRLSEERYRMLAENMSDTVWLMDMSLRTTYISPSVTRQRGFTLDEINMIPLERQMTPASLQRALQMFAETLSPENLAQPDRLIPRAIELEFYKKDGTKFWSENTFTLIRDSQGQPFAILGSGRDISERKNAQEKLLNSEKYFRLLIENNTDAVVLLDPRGIILYESPQNARMLGRTSGQRLGKSGYEFIHPEDKGSVAQMLNELVQHPGAIHHIIFRNQHKDGSWRWIEATATNLLGESSVHGLVINMHDITGRKRAEGEVRRRVADLEVLYENGLSIGVLLEPRKIAQKLIEGLSEKLDWHHASIQLIHPETNNLELLALSKPGLNPDQTQVEVDRLKNILNSPNQGLCGWVIKHGKTVRSGDIQMDKRYLLVFPEIRSGMYIPLMIGDRAIGSIAVESRQANRFSEEDERLLKTLAAQSAIAFENARLYQEAVSAAKRKAALHQGSLEIVRAGQEIEAICIALHHTAQQVMPAEVFIVSLLTENGREVEAPYLNDQGIRHPNTRLPVEAGLTGRVIKSKKPLRIKDVQKSKGTKPVMVDGVEPTRAILSVPLLAQDKIIGVLSAQSRESYIYTVEDQIFMETLASEAAFAFENARLFAETRRRLTELESLSQVSDSLTSAIDLQPLLENILAGARNAIPAGEKGTIFLTEPDGALRLHAMSGYTDPRLIGLILLPDQKGYAARVARERNPIKIDDAHADYEIPNYGAIEEIDSVQSGIAAPLIVKGKVIGLISLDNASRKAAFTESDLSLLVTFAYSASVAIENARLFTETQQRLHRLSALHSIDATIGASVDTHVTLGIVLEHVMTELKADAAAVLLFNPLTRTLEYTTGRGFRVHVIDGFRLRLGEGLAGQAVLQRRSINITDLQQAGAVEQVMEHPVSGSTPVPLQYLEGENFVGYHAIPLIAKGQVHGVLEIFRRSIMQVDQEWITFFEMVAGQTAIAIDNGRLFENLQQSNLELTLAYDATIQGWSQALELRDEETEGHTLRVTDLTLRLIQAMGLEEVEMEHARRGSLLHDIGKIAIPDSILLKPGSLNEHEWSVMRQHPQYAYNMLSPITYLAPAIHIPWCHHEKWDGSGYPRGLKGEQIPTVARIFAIVDVFDALTSNRPYRLAWPREKALEYINEQSGKHFDPKVEKAFLDLMAGEK